MPGYFIWDFIDLLISMLNIFNITFHTIDIRNMGRDDWYGMIQNFNLLSLLEMFYYF